MSCRLWILYYITHSICIVDFTCVIISFGCSLRFTMSEVNTLDATQRSNLWVLRINYTLGTLKRLITNVCWPTIRSNFMAKMYVPNWPEVKLNQFRAVSRSPNSRTDAGTT